MKREKWFGKRKLLFLMMLCMMVFGTCLQAQAASNLKKLAKGKTYSTTLTGSAKHKVSYTYSKQDSVRNSLNIYVDGSKVGSVSPAVYDWEVYLIKVASGRTLIAVRDNGDNDYNNYLNIYEYKNKKLNLLANLCKTTRNTSNSKSKLMTSWARCSLKSVGTNSLVLRWVDTGRSIGMFYIDVTYKISGNKITRAGSVYSLKRPTVYTKLNWTATRSFNTYTTAGGSKKSFRVTKGQKITGLQVTRKGGFFYYKVKNSSGKTGWFRDSATYQNGACIKEAQFAG